MSKFQIFSSSEIASLRRGGRILHECLDHVASKVQPGVTTGMLDEIAETFIRDHGGAPAFKGYHGYPASLCTSVNDACVHGLPGRRELKDGDIIALDCGVLLDDLYTDACVTVPVGSIFPEIQVFLDVTKSALGIAVDLIKEGVRIGDISSSIQQYVESHSYHCVPALTGHGLGTTLHQFPDIPNVGKAGTGPKVPSGTIIAIEPITSMGAEQIRESGDGWTIHTADGALSAHFEHTVLVKKDGYEVLA